MDNDSTDMTTEQVEEVQNSEPEQSLDVEPEQEPDTDVQDQEEEQDDDNDQVRELTTEAKKYRKRAQQAEANLEALQARHDNLIRSVAVGYSKRQGVNENMLFGAGAKPSDLLDEEGRLDQYRIQKVMKEAKRHFGISTAEDPSQGTGRGYNLASTDWSTAFKSAKR